MGARRARARLTPLRRKLANAWLTTCYSKFVDLRFHAVTHLEYQVSLSGKCPAEAQSIDWSPRCTTNLLLYPFRRTRAR